MRTAFPSILKLKRWTPKAAHTAAVKRLTHIQAAYEEVISLYADIDETVVADCEDRIAGLAGLKDVLNEALAEGRSL